jgi:hypothetical protein
MAEVTPRIPLLPRRVHERVGEHVWRAGQLHPEMDPPVCGRTLCKAGSEREGGRHGAG